MFSMLDDLCCHHQATCYKTRSGALAAVCFPLSGSQHTPGTGTDAGRSLPARAACNLAAPSAWILIRRVAN